MKTNSVRYLSYKRGLLPTRDATLHLVKTVEFFHRINGLGTSSTPWIHLGRFKRQHKQFFTIETGAERRNTA